MAGFLFALFIIFLGLVILAIIASPSVVIVMWLKNVIADDILLAIIALLAVLFYISLVATIVLKLFAKYRDDF